MSSLAQPMIAPNSSVTAPTMTTASWAVGARLYSGPDRTIKYTPAVTMVAAWISADTGVGPSIASPSQACSGTCADLAHAPNSINNPIAVSTARLAAGTPANTPAYDRVPKVLNVKNIPTARPASPTRFITNAFLAAVAADGLWYQKPINRYDARPTPSQPTYSNT
ncbi:Uncharacterised protein [Mycobacterium tuberculosis]|nr:Uncharacterised protein [Mycobacterium tuberculosis]